MRWLGVKPIDSNPFDNLYVTYSPLTYSQQKNDFKVMDIKQKIGQHIKDLRSKKNLTQLELSELSGLDRTYITSVENGRRNISIINLERIVHALGLSLSKFFNDEKFESTNKR